MNHFHVARRASLQNRLSAPVHRAYHGVAAAELGGIVRSLVFSAEVPRRELTRANFAGESPAVAPSRPLLVIPLVRSMLLSAREGTDVQSV